VVTVTDVWVIETGEYEDRYVHGVAASLEAAVRGIEGEYASPYVVRWEPLRRGDDGNGAELVGHSEAVAGYSTRHTAVFDIRPCTLLT